jgi:hypothetical protein
MAKVRPAYFVAGGERHLDHPEPIVGLGLQFKHDAAVAHALGFQDLVMLAAAIDISDWVAWKKGLDGDELAEAHTL